MRGADIIQESLFSTVHLDSFIPKDHPLRDIRVLIDQAMAELDTWFSTMYSDFGRESIAPEKLLRASLLQILYTIRSERQLVEQIQYNLLYRWFVGLSIEDTVWNHSTFSKNRDRLIDHETLPALLQKVVDQARQADLVSDKHFSVDGTLIQAWASQKSFQPRDDDTDPPSSGRNTEVDFRGEKRSNETHQSSTDPECLLARKSKGSEAKLSYRGHHLMENRNGLIVGACVSQATGRAERDIADQLISELPGSHNITIGADKNYDTREFVEACRENHATPHVSQNLNRRGGSAIDGRTTRHKGYEISQCIRKRIEETFGWGKTIGPIRQVKVRGEKKVNAVFQLTAIAWDLVRIKNLLRQQCVQCT